MCKFLGSFALVLINVLILLISIIFIITGALLQWGNNSVKENIIPGIVSLTKGPGNATISMNELSQILTGYVGILGNAGLIIFIIGCILLVISFCGSFGVFLKNRLLLNLYVALTFLIWVLVIIFIIVFFTKRSALQHNGNKEYTKLLEQQYLFNDGSQAVGKTGLDISGIIDLVQAKLHCCGSTNYGDFVRNPGYNKTFGVIPYSCCKMIGNSFQPQNATCTYNPDSSNSYLNQGCYSELWKIIQDYSDYAGYCLIGLAGLLIILIIIAVILQYSYGEKDSVVI